MRRRLHLFMSQLKLRLPLWLVRVAMLSLGQLPLQQLRSHARRVLRHATPSHLLLLLLLLTEGMRSHGSHRHVGSGTRGVLSPVLDG